MNLVPPWSGCRGYRVESLAAAVLLVLAAAQVQPALMAQTPAPVIEKLNPDSGPVGTKVKVKGSNFGTSGTVTFNGTAASPTSMVGNVGSQSTKGQEGPRRKTRKMSFLAAKLRRERGVQSNSRLISLAAMRLTSPVFRRVIG